ncbi:MAG: hypothetical protein V4675_25145 [Verrucomicrobiota bacterium]
MTTDQLEAPAAVARQGKPRASDPVKVLSLIQAQEKKQAGRLEIYRAVEAAYDRVPPDDDSALDADKLGWTANIDWGGMESGVDEGAEIDYNLATQPDTYVRLLSGMEQMADLLSVVEQEDKRALDDWEEWLDEMEMMVHNRRAHGMGIFHFPHPQGWHFSSLHPGNLITPPQGKKNPGKWPWFAIKTEFRITDLLARLEDPEASAVVGWDVGAIRQAVAKFAEHGGQEMVSSIEKNVENYVLELRAGDLAFAQENNNAIPGFIFYVAEWDGGVSEYFLTTNSEVGFLFKGVKRHAAMGDVIALFPLSLGQGYIERVRGYGVKMLPYHDLENQTRNRFVDSVMLASGMIVQGEEGDDWQRLQSEVRQYGPYTFFPDGLNVNPQSFGDPSGGIVALNREMERVGGQRNRSFGGADHSQRTPEMTATQSRMLWQGENKAQTNEVARFYKQLSHFHKLRFRRMFNPQLSAADPGGPAAIEMIKRLTEKGVTIEVLASIHTVKARTIFGDGDPVNQYLAMKDLEPFFGRFTEDGKKAYTHHVVAARIGDRDLAAQLTGYKGTEDRNKALATWQAQQENAVFEVADTRLDLGDRDNHLIHLGEHTVFAEEVVARLDGKDLTEAEAFQKIGRAFAHVQQHLVLAAQDPLIEAVVKDVARRWADLNNRQRQLGQHLKAEQEKSQREQIEEMRTPRPNVKDTETRMTQEIVRSLAMERHKREMELLEQRHELEMRMLAQGKAVEQQGRLLAGLGEVGE